MKFARVAIILAVLMCMLILPVFADETEGEETNESQAMNETKPVAKVAPKVASLLKTVPWRHSQIMKNATALAKQKNFTIDRQARIDLSLCVRNCNTVAMREMATCKQFRGSQRKTMRQDGNVTKAVTLSSCRHDLVMQSQQCKKQCQVQFHY
jgi:hypothetical protein